MNTVPVELLLEGGTVLTVDADRRILRDAAIAIDGGRIVAVDDRETLSARYIPRERMDTRGKVITPGFVDAHVHLSHQLHRSLLADTFPEEREHDHWLPYWSLLTRDDAELSARLACAEMAMNGTTLFSDMSGRYDGELQAAAARSVGIRGSVAEICWDIPPHPSVSIGDTRECLDRLESLVTRMPLGPDADVWAAVSMSGMGRASDDLIAGASAIARAHGVPLSMHQSFAAADTAAFRERTGGLSAVQHLESLGVTGPDLTLVHMIQVEPVEVDVLARTGTNTVHCPGASVRWGLGASRTGLVPELLDAGVNVGLGSDSANYSDALDVAHQMYLAATINREARGGTPHVSADQALAMATIDGARALGVDRFAGSIEAGKWADLVVHDGDRPEWRPGIDPLTTLVYSARSRGVETVLVAGRAIVTDGRVPGLSALLDDASRAAERLLVRMSDDPRFAWPR